MKKIYVVNTVVNGAVTAQKHFGERKDAQMNIDTLFTRCYGAVFNDGQNRVYDTNDSLTQFKVNNTIYLLTSHEVF